MKPRLRDLFVEYDACHQHPMNRLTHKVGVPLIFFNALAMLDWVRLVPLPGLPGELTLGHLALLGSCAWYLAMSARLGVILTIAFAALLAVGRVTPAGWTLAAGAAGWVVQLLGHKVWEKNSPNFTTNMIQALVGPIFLVALATGDWPAAARGLRRSTTAPTT